MHITASAADNNVITARRFLKFRTAIKKKNQCSKIDNKINRIKQVNQQSSDIRKAKKGPGRSENMTERGKKGSSGTVENCGARK